MPVTNYHTVNGRTIGEATDGARTDYLTDALGSVTATVDQSQNVLNTYRYKPYGGLLAKTGSSPDPRFLWTGDTGSRTTGASYAEQYNRARHYGSGQAGWTSVDPLWPWQLAYSHAAFAPEKCRVDRLWVDAEETDCTVRWLGGSERKVWASVFVRFETWCIVACPHRRCGFERRYRSLRGGQWTEWQGDRCETHGETGWFVPGVFRLWNSDAPGAHAPRVLPTDPIRPAIMPFLENSSFSDSVEFETTCRCPTGAAKTVKTSFSFYVRSGALGDPIICRMKSAPSLGSSVRS